GGQEGGWGRGGGGARARRRTGPGLKRQRRQRRGGGRGFGLRSRREEAEPGEGPGLFPAGRGHVLAVRSSAEAVRPAHLLGGPGTCTGEWRASNPAPPSPVTRSGEGRAFGRNVRRQIGRASCREGVPLLAAD